MKKIIFILFYLILIKLVYSKGQCKSGTFEDNTNLDIRYKVTCWQNKNIKQEIRLVYGDGRWVKDMVTDFNQNEDIETRIQYSFNRLWNKSFFRKDGTKKKLVFYFNIGGGKYARKDITYTYYDEEGKKCITADNPCVVGEK